MNACSFCKNGKRKCDKVRPSCSNCLRLRKTCVYIEDTIQTDFASNAGSSRPPLELHGFQLDQLLPGIQPFSQNTLRQSTGEIAIRILGSLDNMLAVSTEFFLSTHQRLPVISKYRFYNNLQTPATKPRADFAALCLCILLIQQMPVRNMADVQSPLYITLKTLINWLEATDDLSLDLLHCTILITFYEMGHGLNTAAYLSVAACVRIARVLGLHRKAWRNVNTAPNKLILEEQKRMWWAIVNMERFIGLCNGDALLMTADPYMSDPIPIEDLLWAECLVPADLEGPITAAPTLNTPANITVGQMARECQISHLAGRVVRHLFDPTPNLNFNEEEAIQLERTLKAYLPLLADEELKIGRYCAAFAICNSALFILHEFTLNNTPENNDKRQQVLQSMEETSLRAFAFADTAVRDRENYPYELRSPYLPYSLYQAAIVQYRLWKHSNDPTYNQRFNSLKIMLRNFGTRWMAARKFLEILENLDGSWPPIALPSQGLFISTGRPTS